MLQEHLNVQLVYYVLWRNPLCHVSYKQADCCSIVYMRSILWATLDGVQLKMCFCIAFQPGIVR